MTATSHGPGRHLGSDGWWRSDPADPGDTGERDARLSFVALLYVPLALVAAYALGAVLLGTNDVAPSTQGWGAFARVLLLTAVVEAPAVVALRRAVAARHAGARSGRTAVVVSSAVIVLLALTTLVPGTIQAFS